MGSQPLPRGKPVGAWILVSVSSPIFSGMLISLPPLLGESRVIQDIFIRMVGRNEPSHQEFPSHQL